MSTWPRRGVTRPEAGFVLLQKAYATATFERSAQPR